MVRKILYTFGKTANFLLNLCHGFLFVCLFSSLLFWLFGFFWFVFLFFFLQCSRLDFSFKLYESAILDTRELV